MMSSSQHLRRTFSSINSNKFFSYATRQQDFRLMMRELIIHAAKTLADQLTDAPYQRQNLDLSKLIGNPKKPTEGALREFERAFTQFGFKIERLSETEVCLTLNERTLRVYQDYAFVNYPATLFAPLALVLQQIAQKQTNDKQNKVKIILNKNIEALYAIMNQTTRNISLWNWNLPEGVELDTPVIKTHLKTLLAEHGLNVSVTTTPLDNKPSSPLLATIQLNGMTKNRPVRTELYSLREELEYHRVEWIKYVLQQLDLKLSSYPDVICIDPDFGLNPKDRWQWLEDDIKSAIEEQLTGDEVYKVEADFPRFKVICPTAPEHKLSGLK